MMDLEIKDVAELLNTSPSKVKSWIKDDRIPFYMIEGHYRFSRMEIEDWVLNKHPEPCEEESETPKGSTQFCLYRAIHNGAVLEDVPGEDKVSVIHHAMESIAQQFNLDADVLTELILDRENLQPTGLNNGIGLPHTRDSFVNAVHDRVIVAFPKKAIVDYGALDGEPVHTLFFLFARDDKEHLHLLAKIAHLSSDTDARRLIEQKPAKAQLLEYIREWEGKLARKLK